MNKTDMEDSKRNYFLVGFTLGMAFITIFIVLGKFPINLDQSTGNDLCYNLTNNSSVIASSSNGKLICEIPSYEAESNIIIKNISLEGGDKT